MVGEGDRVREYEEDIAQHMHATRVYVEKQTYKYEQKAKSNATK